MMGPNRRRWILFLGAVLAVLLISFAAALRAPPVAAHLAALNSALYAFAVRFGFAGAFVISFAASASILVQIPYAPPVMVLAYQSQGPGWLMALTLVTGLGLTAGELVPYLIGRGLHRTVPGAWGDRLPALRAFIRRRPRLIPLLVFVFAATPLPDDVLLVPLGMMKYGIRRLLLPMLVGKILLAAAFVFGGWRLGALLASSRLAPLADEAGLLLAVLLFFVVVVGFNLRWMRGPAAKPARPTPGHFQ